jgi:hypothetical protein
MLLFKKAYIVFIVSFFAVTLNAQDTIKPEPKKTIRNFINPDSLSLINLKIVPVPILTSTPETGVRFGLALEYFFNSKEKQTEARGSYVHGQVTYSTKSQFDINGSWQIFGRGEKYVYRGSAGFQRFNERYWGIGNTSTPNDAYNSQFYNRVYLESKVFKLLKNQTYLGIAINYSNTYNVTYSKPLLTSDNAVPGIFGSKVLGLGPAFLHDSRDYPFSALKGKYAELYYQYHMPIFGDNFNYSEWMVDLRKYYPLTKTSTLAFQLMSRNTIGNVPLREIPRLGSSNLMRGFFTGRFRDLSYTAAQGEFRFNIWRWIGGATFGSAGLVGETISNYETKELKYSGGAGLRFLVNKKNRMILRLDYALSNSYGSAYYIRLNEAF